MSTSVSAYLSSTAVTRAGVVLPDVQETVPEADLDYVCAGAVRVGLNRLNAKNRGYKAADYVTTISVGASLIAIAVEDDDVARADVIAAAASVTRAVVVSAAACTGLAMLTGLDVRIDGPFIP
jgi:hypothetical protein